MAIINFSNDPGSAAVATALLAIAVLLVGARRCFSRTPFPAKAPPLTSEYYSLIGSLQFFTQRWDFFRRSMERSKTGNFSFYAGQWPVVGIGSDEGRRVYLESKGLSFNEGYAALLGGTPSIREDNNPLTAPSVQEDGFDGFFAKRLHVLMKPSRLRKSIPRLIADTRERLDELVEDGNVFTDPFESIYSIVFKLTMRTVACDEIADNPELLAKVLKLFEQLDGTATPMSIMYPWLPTKGKIMRTWYGSQLYMILKHIVDDRKRQNRTEDDALQHLMDQDDSLTMIITFVLGSLFAGQLNTGVNAAWILVRLATNLEWMDRVLKEIRSVADQHSNNSNKPLQDRLIELPAQAWETSFPVIDACLKESIRLSMPGTSFRKNTSGFDIPLDKDCTEVIPKDAYVALSTDATFHDSTIFASPDEWDPHRFGPDRAEDKKRQYGWWGWGVARHPCPGMRFAKLEITIIVAFFLAYFEDIQLMDQEGKPTDRLPSVDRNRHTAHISRERVYLKCRERPLAVPDQ